MPILRIDMGLHRETLLFTYDGCMIKEKSTTYFIDESIGCNTVGKHTIVVNSVPENENFDLEYTTTIINFMMSCRRQIEDYQPNTIINIQTQGL